VSLVSETWAVTLHQRPGGFAWHYHRPVRIETSGPEAMSRPIHDHVMIARLGAMLALILATLARRFQT
jgi:hypothetical protein